MKVKFENCEVELWKLRKGTVVVDSYGKAGHISYLGDVWEYSADVGNVVDITVEREDNGAVRGHDTNSYRLLWVEPS